MGYRLSAVNDDSVSDGGGGLVEEGVMRWII